MAVNDGELRQSEIITNLVQFTHYDQKTRDAFSVTHPYTIVLSQDCDLLRDFECRNSENPSPLNGVLLFELQPLEFLKFPGSDIRKFAKQNRDDRYHTLGVVPSDQDSFGLGLPELVIDFRRCYTVPPDEIYKQCGPEEDADAKRRCRLESPYREHLQNRAAYYLQRVALPD